MYQVILFGFSNIPASFQSYINKIQAKKFDIFVIIYLNNIQVNSTLIPFNKFLKNWGKTAFLPSSISINFIKTKFAF